MNVKKKVRVLHINDSGGQGGAEQVLILLIENLGFSNYEHYVIVPHEGWLTRRLSEHRQVNIKIINGSGSVNLKFVGLLVRFILNEKIQIVHSHLLGSSLYASIAGTICFTPVVCTFHGFVDIEAGGKLQKLKLWLVGRLSSKIVTVSHGLKKYIVERIPFVSEKISVVYNGVQFCKTKNKDNFFLKGCSDLGGDEIIIGSVGNVKKAKGYDVLLNVAKIVHAKYDKIRFLIAGNINNEIYGELLEIRRSFGLESEVIFLDYQEDISQFLSSLDVFLLTSYTEGFSIASIEAMHAGIPIVATRSGGPQELIKHDFNGLLAKVADYEELARLVLSLIEDTDLRNRLSRDAKNDVKLKYEVGLMINEYKKIYNKCLKMPVPFVEREK